MNRRKFVRSVSGTVGAMTVAGLPLHQIKGQAIPSAPSGSLTTLKAPSVDATAPMTIQDAIDMFIKAVPGAPFPKTVDTVKSGDPQQPLKGIVTTMFATIDVIEQAAKLGVNLIIAHEPTFYNHPDDTAWLKTNDVFKYKQDLLNKHQMVVWRCHDYIHSHNPDGVYERVLDKLGWKNYSKSGAPWKISLPATSLQSVIDLAKARLDIPMVRYMGDPSSLCKSVLLMVGAAGGTRQINGINQEKPDLVIIGELVEWETLEYMRDLRSSGSKTSLIILGHIPSEEPGMEWLADWLKPKLPGVIITHIPSGTPVTWA